MTLQNIKISLRSDSLENWISSDPVLKNGELVMVNDISAGLVRFKVGNGVSAFVQLPYVNEKKVITDFAKAKRAESQYFSQGVNNSASPLGFAAGSYLTADSSFAQVLGVNACAPEGHDYSFVWNGDSSGTIGVQSYRSHGEGTFNINPADGVNGFYVGNQTLSGILSSTCQPKGNYLSSNALDGKADILPFAPTFEDFIEGEPARHIWSEDSEYSAGDSVVYEGKFYACIQDADGSHPPTDTDYWNEIPYYQYAQYNGFSMMNVSWQVLVGMRDAGVLFPGVKYRITDYVTMVDQEDCRSAEHPFDLIVTAIDHNTLDEHAVATLPSNGDDYFAARPFHYEPYQQYLEYKRVPLESWEIKYCLDNDDRRFAWADTENGKGVIYYMKDEFGNEAPYDFKNVQFKRYRITSSPGETYLKGMYGLPINGIEVDEEDIMWCYTFNGTDYQDLLLEEPYDFSGWHPTLTDATVQQLEQQTGQTLMGIDRLNGCSKNAVLEWCESLDDYLWTSYALPNNVFQCQLDQTPLGDSVPFLKIGLCISNKLGLNCCGNTFGNYCNDNTFGSYCNNNTFGNSYNSNIFGDGCNNNTFGDNCYSNTFGNNCYSNTFGDNCDSNTFGNNCYSNTFGNNCYSNTFGDNCDYIKFASTNISDPDQAKSYYKSITVDSGNQYIILNCTQSTYYGNEYKNVRILPGVNNTSSYKTITDSNVNQSFCTTYQPANSQVIAI